MLAKLIFKPLLVGWLTVPTNIREKIEKVVLAHFSLSVRATVEASSCSVKTWKLIRKQGHFDLVVHVGAHRGQEFKQYKKIGVKRIIWIEANPVFVYELVERAKKSEEIEQTVVNALVTSQDDDFADLHIYSNDGASSSILLPSSNMKKHFPNVMLTGETVRTRTRTLTKILAELSLASQTAGSGLLIIDTQGGELGVLNGLNESSLNLFSHVVCETSSVALYEGAPLASDLVTKFETLGFIPVTRIPEIHGDVLFRRISPNLSL